MDPRSPLIALALATLVAVAAAADDAARPGASIGGTIRDAKGKPIAGATVSVEGGASATTAADGTYAIASVAPGDAVVTAEIKGRFRVQTMFRAAVGEARNWDASIDRSGVIRGRVVDEYGHALSGVDPPYHGWHIWAMPEPEWMRSSYFGEWGTFLGADGSFQLWLIPGVMYRLRVSPPRSWSRSVLSDPMTPGVTGVTLRVPPAITPHARILCRLEAPDGKALAEEVTTGAAIYLLQPECDCSGPILFDRAESKWISRPVAPGTYSVVAFHPVCGEYEFPPVVVKDAADVEVGTLRYPAKGRVRLTPARSGPGSDGVPAVMLRRLLSHDDPDAHFHKLWVVVAAPELRGDDAVDVDVAPGRYVAVVHLPRSEIDIEKVEIPFEVRSGETTNLTVPLHGAPKRRIHLRYPGLRPALVMVRASDAAGVVEGRVTVAAEADVQMNLVPGRHELVVATSDRRRLTATLDIPEEKPPDVFNVVLR